MYRLNRWSTVEFPGASVTKSGKSLNGDIEGKRFQKSWQCMSSMDKRHQQREIVVTGGNSPAQIDISFRESTTTPSKISTQLNKHHYEPISK